jgi:SAM-dependent methyltransferase
MTVWDEVSARQWADRSTRVEDVAFPWHLAADLVREDADGPVARVLDAAAGPGGFLGAVLDTFPDARGVWLDVSETMLGAAQENLARFGDRVSFLVADMVTMPGAGAPGSFDLVTTSRATHHLAVPELTRFYQRCAELLAPGGWLANLDSMSESPEWRRRLRAVRAGYRAAAGRPEVSTHPHPNVAPRVGEHLAALCAAGFTEAEVVWRSFVTGLLMARKIDPVNFLRKPA